MGIAERVANVRAVVAAKYARDASKYFKLMEELGTVVNAARSEDEKRKAINSFINRHQLN